jgi:hypothetical protein
MATAAEILRRLESINVIADTGTVIDKNVGAIYNLQYEQLEMGLGSDGKPLMSILDDPYFNGNKAKAWAYATFKEAISKKYGFKTPFGQPNLFINGYTHDSLRIQRHGAEVHYTFGIPWAQELDVKYKGKELGLSVDRRHIIKRDVIRPELIEKYSKILGCRAK